MIKKTLLVTLVLVIIGWVITYGHGSEATDFRIGVILPLTGNFAAIGERAKNGFELAREDIKKSSGVDMHIIYEDGCLPKDYMSALNKLLSSDKVTLLGGSYCITGFVPAVSVLERQHVLGINLAPNPDSVINHKFVISTNSSIQLKAGELGKFAAKKLGAKTATIIYYNTQLGEDYRKYFTESFEKLGGKVISTEMTMVEATDFRSELTKAKSAKPDVIFLVQLTKPLGNLLAQANELGISSKILGNSQEEDPVAITIAGKSAEGFLVSSDDPIPVTSVVEDFNARYKAKYGQDANLFARNAYDALMLESAAYAKCGTATDRIITYLHSIKDYQGASGTITIQPDGTSFKGTTFKIVKDGKFVPYTQQ